MRRSSRESVCTKLETALDRSVLLICKNGAGRNGKAAHREKAELDSQTENSHCLRDFPLGLVFLYVFRRLFIQMVWGIDALGNSAMLGGWTAL